MPRPALCRRTVAIACVLALCISLPALSRGNTPFMATLEEPSYFERTAALYALLEVADTGELRGYLEEAAGIERLGARRAWTGIVYARYVQLDPEGAIDHILAAGYENETDYLYAAFCNWAEVDPEAAIARSLALKRLPRREVAKQAILSAQSELDADALAALSQRLGPPSETHIDAVLAQKIDHLARSDPAAALQQALRISNVETRKPLLQSIGRAWAVQDPEGALAKGEQIPDPASRQAFREGVITERALDDPTSLLSELESGSYSRGERYGIINYVFTDLAGRDPAGGVELAAQIQNSELRGRAWNALFGSLQRGGDPAQLYALIEQANDEHVFRSYGPAALAALAASDPERALSLALTHPRYAADQVAQVVSAVSGTDPERALRMAQSLENPQFRVRALGAVVEQLAATDPLLAMETLTMLPAGAQRASVRQTIVMTWSRHDPAAAAAWVLAQPEPVRGELLDGGLKFTLVSHNLPAALAIYEQIESEETRYQWAQQIVQRLAQERPADALDWLQEQSELPNYSYLVRQAVSSLAQWDIALALAAAEQLATGSERDAALSSAVSTWSDWDAPAAAAWVARNEQNPDMVVNVAVHWAQYDIRGAEDWLMTLDNVVARDQALSSLANNASQYGIDPAGLIGNITDREVREAAVIGYAQRLAYRDPDAAREFMAEHGISESVAASILTAVEPGRWGD